MDVEGYLKECATRVDAGLRRALADARGPGDLSGAMAHLLFPGGKRIRPAVAFAACRAAGGAADAALAPAVAVELIHTYSLIHDDLPCMDDDALRRGRPTVHVAYTEALAVLAGDALQALAFQCIADSGLPSEGVGELARAVGALGLVGGQADDLSFSGGSADAITSVHRRKTAALFEVSASLGARCAGADEAKRAIIARIGLALGLAFQIADDCLDRDRDEPCSVLRVYAPDEALAWAESLVEEALGEAEDLGEAAQPLRMLARFAVRRDR